MSWLSTKVQPNNAIKVSLFTKPYQEVICGEYTTKSDTSNITITPNKCVGLPEEMLVQKQGFHDVVTCNNSNIQNAVQDTEAASYNESDSEGYDSEPSKSIHSVIENEEANSDGEVEEVEDVFKEDTHELHFEAGKNNTNQIDFDNLEKSEFEYNDGRFSQSKSLSKSEIEIKTECVQPLDYECHGDVHPSSNSKMSEYKNDIYGGSNCIPNIIISDVSDNQDTSENDLNDSPDIDNNLLDIPEVSYSENVYPSGNQMKSNGKGMCVNQSNNRIQAGGSGPQTTMPKTSVSGDVTADLKDIATSEEEQDEDFSSKQPNEQESNFPSEGNETSCTSTISEMESNSQQLELLEAEECIEDDKSYVAIHIDIVSCSLANYHPVELCRVESINEIDQVVTHDSSEDSATNSEANSPMPQEFVQMVEHEKLEKTAEDNGTAVEGENDDSSSSSEEASEHSEGSNKTNSVSLNDEAHASVAEAEEPIVADESTNTITQDTSEANISVDNDDAENSITKSEKQCSAENDIEGLEKCDDSTTICDMCVSTDDLEEFVSNNMHQDSFVDVYDSEPLHPVDAPEAEITIAEKKRIRQKTPRNFVESTNAVATRYEVPKLTKRSYNKSDLPHNLTLESAVDALKLLKNCPMEMLKPTTSNVFSPTNGGTSFNEDSISKTRRGRNESRHRLKTSSMREGQTADHHHTYTNFKKSGNVSFASGAEGNNGHLQSSTTVAAVDSHRRSNSRTPKSTTANAIGNVDGRSSQLSSAGGGDFSDTNSITEGTASTRSELSSGYNYKHKMFLDPYDQMVKAHQSTTDRRIKSVAAKNDCLIWIEGPLTQEKSKAPARIFRRTKFIYQCTVASHTKTGLEKCINYMKDTFPDSFTKH